LHILSEDLLLNSAYRYGIIRIGCLVCPLASEWREFITEKRYPEEVSRFTDIIDDSLKSKIKDKDERCTYVLRGGWKSRIDGRYANQEGNRILEQEEDDVLRLFISGQDSDWKEWLKALGVPA